jgi:hypothetical protein
LAARSGATIGLSPVEALPTAGLETGVWDGLGALSALPAERTEVAPALSPQDLAAARAVWEDALARRLLPALSGR